MLLDRDRLIELDSINMIVIENKDIIIGSLEKIVDNNNKILNDNNKIMLQMKTYVDEMSKENVKLKKSNRLFKGLSIGGGSVSLALLLILLL